MVLQCRYLPGCENRKRPAIGGPFPLHERETCFSRPLQGLHLRDKRAALHLRDNRAAAAIHRRGNAQLVAVFGDGAAGELDAIFLPDDAGDVIV